MYMFVSLLRVKNYGKDTQFEMRKTAKFVWYNLLVFGQISWFFTRDLLVFQILEWHVWWCHFIWINVVVMDWTWKLGHFIWLLCSTRMARFQTKPSTGHLWMRSKRSARLIIDPFGCNDIAVCNRNICIELVFKLQIYIWMGQCKKDVVCYLQFVKLV